MFKGSTSVEEPVQASGSRQCPGCAVGTGEDWLQAPDRLHGRRQPYTLVRCPQCSLVWLADPPRPEEMYQHYTEAYNRRISGAGASAPHRWRARKATLTQYKQSGFLLDLGCSAGSFLESVRGDSWKLYGIEMSAAEARTAETRSGAQVFVGTVAEAAFPAESFDVITCFDVFEHLYEPRQVMAKVAQWLKPGGIFYVLVPNIYSAESRVFGTYWAGLELPRHLFHYSPDSLRRLAAVSGLRALSLETHRNATIEDSVSYVWEAFLRKLGITRTPVAYRREPGLAWRAARKLVRLTVWRAFRLLAPLAGQGESIHAVFQKGME